MLEFDQAQAQLLDAAGPVAATESLSLRLLAGRVLAEDIVATLDLPPADNSAMDGYAVRHADLAAGTPLPIQQRVYAGEAPQPALPGHATRLFTGSLIPPGADTIIMQEDTREADGHVEVTAAIRPGQHVRKRGEDTTAGKQIVAAGTVLGAGHIALLASQGIAQVRVFRRLRVGVLTTGDELVNPGLPRAEAQIYNSNAPMLATLLEGVGAEVAHVLHARDEEADTREALQTLLRECDLVLSVGGVSVGERDLVKPALEALGATLALWKVRMKPGKPVALAHVDGKPVVSLPGNPVSAFAVFTVLVSPLIRRMQGRTEVRPPVSRLKLRTPAPRRDDRAEFVRVQRHDGEAGGELQLYPHQGSGVMSSLPWCTGLARLPADETVNDGDVVRYYDLRHWLA
ncbi:molybdopterin molybdotransferase MoeA [Bordetella genomosp. 1]|uniref:Molybdopterin molybdenumtransferase n=1 Tax=Bordetella genomosp. 1 TaxID=1395607 RepID=A0ABX4EZH6_9BORD|nr:gephyrin-like molybdotransferase Glp [Bordetella genomosp. 1]OZI65156.1 molybdopterin molybdenumtransferase MoeA [Bordetella genomosp. 1]